MRSPPTHHSPAPASKGVSTRLRVGLTFAALALLLFSITGALSARQARQQMELQVGENLVQLASRMAHTLDSGMAERYREIQNVAALEPMLETALDAGRWRLVVNRLQATLPHYAWIGVTDLNGTVIASTGSLLEGRDVSQRPWFSAGLQGAYVGDVHEALLLASLLPPTGDGEPLRLIDVAAPIYSGDAPVGVLGAHLSWAWAEERKKQLLDVLDPNRKVEVIVLNGKGERLTGTGGLVDARLGRDDIDALLGKQHAVLTWSDGARYVTAAVRRAPQPDYPGLGWTVLVRQPVDTAMQAASTLQTQIAGLGLLGAALFGLLSWALSARLTAPLREVARRAQALAGVETGSAAPSDEVAQLSASLRVLMAQLQQRQEDLQFLNETLEQRVDQRTHALAQANEDLQSFSRNVSHDLKGPIGSIGAATRHVLDTEGQRLGTASLDMLRLVVDECERLRKVVDELMTLARTEQQPLRLESVDMNVLVRAAAAELLERHVPQNPQGAAAEGKASPVLQLAPLPEVRGDAVLLRQVWQNLLSNAAKFTRDADAPRIEVRAEVHAHEIVFSVHDNGTGFDMRQVDRLFGVFQRLHRTSDYPGTGIGLSIVKRVVHRHGGRVWARSAPGEGASFYFALPRPQTIASGGRASAWPQLSLA